MREAKKKKGRCIDERELKKALNHIFDCYDANKDGFLQYEEIKKMLEDMRKRWKGKKALHPITVMAERMIKESSNTGEISKDDFYWFYKRKI